MYFRNFVGDKLPHLLGLGLGILFLVSVLTALGMSFAPTAFLALVWTGCVLGPLVWEYSQKAPFCRQAAHLEEDEESCIRCAALLRRPNFWEGAALWDLLERSEREMNEKLARAYRENQEYREYVETWVHEIKTPIATAWLAMENYPGLLSDRLEDPLFEIEGYVEQALFYARSSAAEKDYVIQAMSLKKAINRLIMRYARPLITADFDMRIDPQDPVVYSDAKWVDFILGQIVANAIEYHLPNPKLIFAYEVKEQSVVLSITDNGPGIPPEDLPRIFDKGFTGQNGRKRNKHATGLGLYLVKKLCTRLGLGVAVICGCGRGTTVQLTFPRSKYYLAPTERET